MFEGGLLPWRLTVHVRCRRRGGEGKPDELPLPAVLPEPWILDRNSSREQEPSVAEEGQDPATRLWVREGWLIYWSSRRPTQSPLQQLETARPVGSLYLKAAP